MDPFRLAFSLYLSTWWAINSVNGAGLWAAAIPALASQGMCYPSACSKDDISANNIAYARSFFPFPDKSPPIVAQPIVPDALAIVLNVDVKTKEAVQFSAIGCSDDERHSGNWKAENYVMVTILSIIGFLVFAGTTMEMAIRSPYVDSTLDLSSTPGLGSKLLLAFSLISNLEFIFKVVIIIIVHSNFKFLILSPGARDQKGQSEAGLSRGHERHQHDLGHSGTQLCLCSLLTQP